MFVRALLLTLIGSCLVTAPGCGTKAPEVAPPAGSPTDSAASRRYMMKPEHKQVLGKDGKLLWKPGMKQPTPNAGAAPKP